MFPRSIERGLIEAELDVAQVSDDRRFRVRSNAASLKPGIVTSPPFMDSLRFRVRSNAASLKRVSLGCGRGAVNQFPRSIERGLIEAYFLPAVERSRRSFRVRSNAASLKRGAGNGALPVAGGVSAFDRTRPH